MQTKKVKRVSRFTLIEVLAVVVIIGLLAAVIAPFMIGKTDDTKYKMEKVKIKNLSGAIELFNLEMGRLPNDLNELKQNPGDRKWGGPYWKDKLKDTWGNDYIYTKPGSHYKFDLISMGVDGQQGGEGLNKDIGNWEETEE